MEPYRIDIHAATVDFKLVDLSEMTGKLFLPAESTQSIPVELTARLNGSDRFLAVELPNEQRVLWNKDRVMWCRWRSDRGAGVYSPRRRVTLLLDDMSSVHGDLIVDGPPDRQRVLDLLNMAEDFVRVDRADGCILVNKRCISCVPSPELGEEEVGAEAEFELEETRQAEAVSG